MTQLECCEWLHSQFSATNQAEYERIMRGLTHDAEEQVREMLNGVVDLPGPAVPSEERQPQERGIEKGEGDSETVSNQSRHDGTPGDKHRRLVGGPLDSGSNGVNGVGVNRSLSPQNLDDMGYEWIVSLHGPDWEACRLVVALRLRTYTRNTAHCTLHTAHCTFAD